MSVTYVLLARIPVEGVHAFQAYEEGVLALLGEHGGVLERRLRSPEELVEVHVISFPSYERFESYREDPRREAFSELLVSSGAEIELYELEDVP